MIKRIVLSALFTLHGWIHLLGFVVYWRLAQVEGIFYRTYLLVGDRRGWLPSARQTDFAPVRRV